MEPVLRLLPSENRMIFYYQFYLVVETITRPCRGLPSSPKPIQDQ